MKSKYPGSFWILLAAPVILLILVRILGFDGLFGQDTYAYTKYSEDLRSLCTKGIKPGFFFWPPGYSLSSFLLFFLPAHVSLQFISTLSLSGCLFYLYRLILHSYPGTSAHHVIAYLFLFCLGAPYFLRNAIVNSSDMLACFCICGSVYHSLTFKNKNLAIDLILFFIYFAYGVITRYLVFLVILPYFLDLLYALFNLKFKKEYVLALIPILLCGLLYAYCKGLNLHFLNHQALETWNIKYYFSKTINSPEGQLNYMFPNIIFSLYPFFHPGFCYLGFLFLFFSNIKLKRNTATLHFISIAMFILFIAGNYFQNPRHLLVIYPLVLISIYPGYEKVSRFLSTKKLGIIFTVMLIIQSALSIRAIYPSFDRNKLEKEITAYVAHLGNENGQRLYSFDISNAVEYRQDQFKVVNLYDTVYSDFQKNSFALINESAWASQWRDKNVMINVHNLRSRYALRVIKEFRKGWVLYQIE